MPVLAPGTGKTKTGRLWVYLRDERPCAGPAPPAVLYRYSPDRKGEHPRRHLARFRGFLHADGYAGFGPLYQAEDGRPATVTEVACWAHVRRKFFDLQPRRRRPWPRKRSTASAVCSISSVRSAACRRTCVSASGRTRAMPLVEELAALLDATLPKLSGKSDLAGAIRYARSRWPALTRYLEDGRLEIDNNAAERAIRAIRDEAFIMPLFFKPLETLEVGFRARRDTGDLFGQSRRSPVRFASRQPGFGTEPPVRPARRKGCRP